MDSINSETSFLTRARQQVTARMGFARLSSDLVFLETSDNFLTVINQGDTKSVIGVALTDLFVEFVGAETYILSICQQKNRVYKLERINRPLSNGRMLYLDFTLMGFSQGQENGAGTGDILLMIEDSSGFGRLEQAIVQERNELRLVRQHLAQANGRLRRLDQLKSLFFSMAAHDLRSPLMVIRGFADLLATGFTSKESIEKLDVEELQTRISTIRVQTDWLDNIIHNVLNLHQVESDQLSLSKCPHEINSIVQAVTDLMQPMAYLNQQTLTAELPPTPLFVNADPQRLEQILQNLIGNAIKYTPPDGSVRVILTEMKDQVEIAVKDTGEGMTPEQVANVFNLYYRTENAKQSKITGTGLGLFIVHTLIKAHDGTIEAESELGKGTTFVFRIPRLHI